MPDEPRIEFGLSEEWQEKLQAGMAIGPFQLDVPMTVNVLPTGAIRISRPCIGVLGSTHPITLLLDFSPLVEILEAGICCPCKTSGCEHATRRGANQTITIPRKSQRTAPKQSQLSI